MVGGELADGTTVTFHRAGTGGDVAIRWYLADFESGVTVQRGSTVVDATPTDVGISAVDVGRSFPLISVTNSDTAFTADDFCRARITTATNLELRTRAAIQATAYWQVVQYANATVQSGQVSLATAQATHSEPVTTVDTTKAWLLYTYTSTAGTVSDQSVEGIVQNEDTLFFQRDTAGTAMSLAWYLVEFTDGTVVQHSSRNFTDAELVRNETLTPVPLSRTLVSLGGAHHTGGRTAYATDNNHGVNRFTAVLNDDHTLQLDRMVHGSAEADVGWFVVAFPAQ
jgi:hypothetical protein